MDNIQNLVKRIESASDKELRKHETELIRYAISTRNSTIIGVLAEHIGIDSGDPIVNDLYVNYCFQKTKYL